MMQRSCNGPNKKKREQTSYTSKTRMSNRLSIYNTNRKRSTGSHPPSLLKHVKGWFLNPYQQLSWPNCPDKKYKLNPMQPRKVVIPTRIPQPSTYAIKKLKSFEYIELWYFIPKSCKEAYQTATFCPTDVFALTKVVGTIVLKTLDATTAS